jgi:lysophospholipase
MDVLAEQALAAIGPRPWVAIAHSMGAHLLLRWLADPARSGHPLRAELRGVVLLAPFLGLGMAWPVRMAVLAAARRQVARGRGTDFVTRQGPYGAASQAPARMALLTGSESRFLDEGRWVAADPALACGGVTWGFLAAFRDSMDALARLPLEDMALPVLVLLAARERLVNNGATERVVARLPNATMETVPDGAHELLREADGPRQRTLSRIGVFVDKVTA